MTPWEWARLNFEKPSAIPDREVYDEPGEYTYDVSGIDEVAEFEVSGAGGENGGTADSQIPGGKGAEGGYVHFSLDLTDYDELTLHVPEWGDNGGEGYEDGKQTDNFSSTGGGSAAMEADSDLIATAGGGGAGGDGTSDYDGGDGGGPDGGAGGDGNGEDEPGDDGEDGGYTIHETDASEIDGSDGGGASKDGEIILFSEKD